MLYKREDGAHGEGEEPLLLSEAEREQPTLPDHARPRHQGHQHEAHGDPGANRGGSRHQPVLEQEGVDDGTHQEEGQQAAGDQPDPGEGGEPPVGVAQEGQGHLCYLQEQ